MDVGVNYNPVPDTQLKPQIPQNPQISEGTTPPLPTVSPEMPMQPAVLIEILSQTLLGYGYKATEENKAMLKLMLDNGIPLTKENVARFNQAVKLTQSPTKALFMLQNNIKMTEKNAAQLEGFVNGQTKITTQLNNIFTTVEQIDDNALKAQIKQILSGSNNETATTVKPEQVQSQQQPQVQSQPQVQAQPQPQVQVQVQTQAQPQAQVQPQPQSQVQPQPQPQPQPQVQPQAQTQTPQMQPQAQPQTTPQTQPPLPQAETPTPQPTAPAPEIQPRVATAQPAAPVAQTAAPQAPPPPASPLPQNLLFNLAGSTPESIDRYISNLREILTQVQQALSERESPGTARVMQEVRTLEAQIDFTSQVRNQIFVQLPMFHDGQQTLTNLHVYRDSKKSSGSDKTTSALIALETASMGHFETYVRKTSNLVQCQFRLESDKITKTVRENIHKLSELLRESGYSLEHFSFLPPGEPYTILDNPENPPPQVSDEMAHFDKRV
ncbi:MAG: hypothetical protein FWF81_10775 [Defluviitaleaceae bacterium]|nr:hypothetical protein [Defluviitaleaceae bacterium]